MTIICYEQQFWYQHVINVGWILRFYLWLYLYNNYYKINVIFKTMYLEALLQNMKVSWDISL